MMKKQIEFSVARKLSKNKNYILSLLRFICFTIAVLSINIAKSQDCNMIGKSIDDYPIGSSLGTSNRIVLPPARIGVETSYEIPLNVEEPYTASLNAISGSCPEIEDSYVLSISGNILTTQIDSRCYMESDNYLFFTLNITKDNCDNESQKFSIPVIRDTVKIALTLDISGSMMLSVQSGMGTRIQELKNAVNALVPKLEEFKQAGDSIGLTYFSSVVYQPIGTYFPKDFIEFSDNIVDNVKNDLLPRNPMQMTAMGLGLLDAKNKLLKFNSSGSNTKKIVFLVTDGLQNYGPLVNTDGNSLNNNIDSLNNLSTHGRDSIKYFTIATWEAANLSPEILDSIATNSGGQALCVVQNDPTLIDWFDVQLYNILEDGSPQIVSRKKDNSLNGPVSYSLSINHNISKLLFQIVTKEIVSISMVLKKDDMVIIPDKEIKGQNFKMYTVSFPYSQNTSLLAGGEWEVILNGNSTKPYNLTTFVDDHLFKYRCKVNKTIYTVGDTMHFSARLSYAGEPLIEGNSSVRAILLKPGDDVGHLLSLFSTPEMVADEDSCSAASYKFRLLMANDTSFYNALLPKEQIVDLTDMGNGQFKGFFTKTELTGIYNIVFLVDGDLGYLGKLQRTTMVSSVFKFGLVVPENPVVEETTGSSPTIDGHGNQGYKDVNVIIRPRNKFGYYMGPGFASVIKVDIKSPGGKATNPNLKSDTDGQPEPFVKGIVDNLDGSYKIVISNVPEKTNPGITIEVRGEKLYSGKIYPIPLWAYILLLVLIILLLIAFYSKGKNQRLYQIILLILTLIVAIILFMHSKGLISFF